ADEERCSVVRMDHDPGVELEVIRIRVGAGAGDLRDRLATREPADCAGDDQRTGRLQELAARDGRVDPTNRMLDGLRKLECRAHASTPSLRSGSALSMTEAAACRTARLIAA